MAIQSGENPKFLRERLLTFMNEKQREGGEAAEGADDGGKKTPGKKKRASGGFKEGGPERRRKKKEEARAERMDNHLATGSRLPPLLFFPSFCLKRMIANDRPAPPPPHTPRRAGNGRGREQPPADAAGAGCGGKGVYGTVQAVHRGEFLIGRNDGKQEKG